MADRTTSRKGIRFDRNLVQDHNLTPVANDQYLSGGADGQRVSLSIPASATYVLMACDEGNEMRWRDVASASAGFGIKMAAGDERWYVGDLSALDVYMSSDTAGYFYYYK